MNSKDVSTFINNVDILIPVKNKNSKMFLEDMRISIDDYVSEHNQCTMDDIVAEFGTEKDIALDYIESLDTDNLIEQLSKTALIRKLIAIVAVSAITALLIFTLYMQHSYNVFKENMMKYEKTVVEQIGD